MGRTIGVDLGATGIKVAMTGKRDRNGVTAVDRIGRRSLNDGDIHAGHVQAKKQVATALGAALADIGAPKSAPLAIAVGGEDVALKVVEVSGAFKPTEWASYIRGSKKTAELGRNLRMSDAAISVVPLRPVEGGNLVAVAGISRQLRDTIMEVADIAGRRVSIIEPSASSLLRSMFRPATRDVAVLVDVGHTQTIVACREGADLMWVDCLAAGGQAITAALAQEFKLSVEEATALKSILQANDVDGDTFGSYDPVEEATAFLDDDDDTDVWGQPGVRDIDPDAASKELERNQVRTLTSRVDDLIDEVAMIVEARVREGYAAPDGVVLTGRGSMIGGMRRRMAERLGTQVHGGLPMADITINKYSRPFVQRDPSQGRTKHIVPAATRRDFAVAIGAAQHPQAR